MAATKAKEIIIRLRVGEDYMDGLQRRMDKQGIRQSDLISATGIDQSQMSRWFNRRTLEGRRMAPSLENVEKIEIAMLKLERAK